MEKMLARLRELEGLWWIFFGAWAVIWFTDHSPKCNFTVWPAQNGGVCRLLKVAFDWQNLLAGFFAIGAAFVGGFFIQQQVKQSERQEEKRRAMEERAAMAVLPLALSELIQYARDCIQLLSPYVDDPPASTMSNSVEAPRIPENTTTALQLCARFAEPHNADKIAKALGKLQVQQARLRDWIEEVRGQQISPRQRLQGLGYMRDAADLYAAIADLFGYSRNEELVRQRASPDALANALHNSDVWGDSHPIWNLIRPPDNIENLHVET